MLLDQCVNIVQACNRHDGQCPGHADSGVCSLVQKLAAWRNQSQVEQEQELASVNQEGTEASVSGPQPRMVATPAESVDNDRAARRTAAIASGRIADAAFAPSDNFDWLVETCPFATVCFCVGVSSRRCEYQPDRPEWVDRYYCLRCQHGEFDRTEATKEA